MRTGDIHPRSFSAMHHVSRVTCHVARHRDDELQLVHHSHVTAPGPCHAVTRLCMTVTSHDTDESGSALIKVKLSISVSVSLVPDESLLRLTKNNTPPPRKMKVAVTAACRVCGIGRKP